MSTPEKLPVVAIVGRPNVGKSTLFNRLSRARRAVVGDQPGVTRDRNYNEVAWRRHRFMLVDTGGLEPDEREGLKGRILGSVPCYLRLRSRMSDGRDNFSFATTCSRL